MSVIEGLNRPVVDGVRLPFACVDDADGGRHDTVVKARAIRCALSRICGICAEVLTRPVAFLGSAEEADAVEFLFPPCHVACAEEAVREHAPRGAVLGHAEAPGEWVVLTTGGFDLVRPTKRGGAVSFRPNSVIGRSAIS
ncbi:hypothetical protein [Aeromicrobium sp. Leaf350]|uniref:hypothetical protein n=1 Tax=Aeromicrobium sp. Leaf350 TaxID=2876565 RepID=UPI001E58C938|nr:hypothetical protein [Aeromicrobium sp. Leaf350]